MLVIRYYPVTVVASLSVDDPIPRAHTCISRKIKTMFKLDSSTGFDEDDGTEPVLSSSDDESGQRRSLRLNPSLSESPLTSTSSTAPQQLALSAAAPTATDTNAGTAVITVSAGTAATASTPTTSSALQRSSSLSTVTFIPNAVWKDVWAPQPGPYTGFFSVARIADDVYATATDGDFVEDLDVRASSMQGLVEAFKTILGDAAKGGDFTHVLCPERAFYM
jgi:hypothetical protein